MAAEREYFLKGRTCQHLNDTEDEIPEEAKKENNNYGDVQEKE